MDIVSIISGGICLKLNEEVFIHRDAEGNLYQLADHFDAKTCFVNLKFRSINNHEDGFILAFIRIDIALEDVQ